MFGTFRLDLRHCDLSLTDGCASETQGEKNDSIFSNLPLAYPFRSFHSPAIASITPTTSVLSMVGLQSEYTRLYPSLASASFPSGNVSKILLRPSLSESFSNDRRLFCTRWVLRRRSSVSLSSCSFSCSHASIFCLHALHGRTTTETTRLFYSAIDTTNARRFVIYTSVWILPRGSTPRSVWTTRSVWIPPTVTASSLVLYRRRNRHSAVLVSFCRYPGTSSPTIGLEIVQN